MPSFKPKPHKRINFVEKNQVTLDSKHDEYLESFEKNAEVDIPELNREKEELKKRFGLAKTLEEKLDIKDRIRELKFRISDLEAKKKEYFLNNSSHIFSYFENKKQISEGSSNTRILDQFFKVSGHEDESRDNNLQKEIQKYLFNNTEAFDLTNFVTAHDVCQFCHQGELIPIDHEGVMVCNVCARTVSYLIEGEKPSYKEPPKEVCFYAYKRINHFREILAQFQAKETTQIPDAVLQDITQQIKKERINVRQITNRKAKEILKKLGYNKYYEHIPFIKDKLGIKPPIMSQELEEKLCNLFMEIQGPYAKYCPDDRVNFLNYYYTVYKLCELLDQNEFLPFFPMLKDREKRIEQDEIWKNICKELDWEFIPTI
jgi:hypothetical protein